MWSLDWVGAGEREVVGGRRELGVALEDVPVGEGAAVGAGGGTVVSSGGALGLFLTGCRGRGLSPVTVEWYERLVGRFLAGRRELPLDAAAVDDFLGLPGASQGTRHAYFRALRAFYGWLERRELVVANPMRLVVAPRVRRSPPMGLEPGEVRRHPPTSSPSSIQAAPSSSGPTTPTTRRDSASTSAAARSGGLRS
jgi:hypothetical protein